MRILYRKAENKDCELLYRWANNSDVRNNSFNPRRITWDEHRKWFSSKLIDPESFLFIFESEELIPLGIVRIERIRENRVIGVTVAPEFRGQGIGSRIIELGCRKFWENKTDDIFAYIKVSNKGSLMAFQNAKFKVVKITAINKIPSFILKASKNDY